MAFHLLSILSLVLQRLLSTFAVLWSRCSGFSPRRQNLALCLLFVIHEWVGVGDWGQRKVLVSLCFGLPMQFYTVPMRIIWAMTELLCLRERSEERFLLNVDRKFRIELGNSSELVFCMDFHGRNYHKASRKLKPYRWKWWWTLFHSPQPRHTVGNFQTACTQHGSLLPKSSSRDGQLRPLNWSQWEVYLRRINHQPLLRGQKSTWGCVLCGHWHADRELKAPGLWSRVLQQQQPGNTQFWLTT